MCARAMSARASERAITSFADLNSAFTLSRVERCPFRAITSFADLNSGSYTLKSGEVSISLSFSEAYWCWCW